MKIIFKIAALGLGSSLLLTSCANASSLEPHAQSLKIRPAVTVSNSGPTEASEPELIETYQETLIPLEDVLENSAPIEDSSDSDLFEYTENVDLTEDQAADRLDALNEEYELGEPFSEKDLELVRAYAGTTLPPEEGNGTPDNGLVVSQAVHSDSTSNGTINPVLFQEETQFENAGFNPFTGSGSKGFSTSKRAQSVSAKFSGTLHKKAKFSGFNNTWRIDAVGAITSGRSNVKKNAVVVTFNSYGAVAKKPFVGRVYSKTVTVPNGSSNLYVDKTYTYDSFETNWTASLKQAITTKKGKFDNPV